MKQTLSAVLLALVLGMAPLSAASTSDDRLWRFLDARMAAESGDYARALTLLGALIEEDPNDPVLLYERALMYVESLRLDRAERELRRVVAVAPEFADAHRLLGRILLDRGSRNRETMDEALGHLRRAFDLQPTDIGTGMMVAQILSGMGRMAEAEPVLAILAERAPDNRTVNYHYAQLLSSLGRGDDAVPFLERVIASDPTFGPAVFQLLESYRSSRRWADAAALLDPLIADDPDNLDMLRQQGFFLLRAGDAEAAAQRFQSVLDREPADERSRYFLAESLSQMGQFVRADEIYESLLEAAPDDRELLLSLGLSRLAQHRYDDAETTFNRILRIEGAEPQAISMAETQLAVVAYHRGEWDLARERAAAILEREPDNLQALGVVLETHRKAGTFDDAIALLQPRVDASPDDPLLVSRLVEFFLRQGRGSDADALTRRLLERKPEAVSGLAEAWVEVKRFDRAIEMLTAASRNAPSDTRLLFQLGATYERAKRYEESEEAFLRLLDENPDHAPTLNYLGYMWADRGVNLERAAAMLEKAVSQEPRNGAYVDSLGWVYFRLGRYDLAEKHLEDAARLIPRDPTIQEHLGDLFAERGDFRRALEKYELALRLDPDEQEAKSIREKLNRMQELAAAQ